MNPVEVNLEKIYELCRKYKVKTLSMSRSILKDRLNDEIGVGFLFRFEPEIDYNNYADLYFALSDELKSLYST